MDDGALPGSFRDPSGHIFVSGGTYYRLVRQGYREDYDLLMRSGLYASLAGKSLLVPHAEVPPAEAAGLSRDADAYAVLRPERIPFISYPYEWCFSELKDAALATLAVQKEALAFGMTLKDASAYNIQFFKGAPVLIDTLSFEKYRDGEPWTPYRQFCQHFLAPLALMRYTDARVNQLTKSFIDGIPLDLACTLLPWRALARFSFFIHLYLHAKSQKRYGGSTPPKNWQVSRHSLDALIDNLESAVRGLEYPAQATEWSGYADNNSYTDAMREEKKKVVGEYLDATRPSHVWDLGANTGTFSRIAADKGIPVVSFDLDAGAVELHYRACRGRGEKNILPLLLDLTNPSPAVGWENRERMSFAERGPADTVLALALIHHLAIVNNVPLGSVARFFGSICRTLIIEFVPKDDVQVRRLLASRKDIFPSYTQECFEKEFASCFSLEVSRKIEGSGRTLYLMRNKTR